MITGKEKFKELNEIVFEGQVDKIHLWFNNSGYDSDSSNYLCKYILNNYSFFSYRSNFLNKISHEHELLKRQLPILGYLNFEDKISLISYISMNNELSLDHFKLLKKSKDFDLKKQNILTDKSMALVFTELFNKELFVFIDSLEGMLGLDIKNSRCDVLGVHYLDSNSRGCFNLIKKKYQARPIDDIIFNYSELKAAYFDKNKIELPDFAYVDNLKTKAIEDVNESTIFRGRGYDKKIEEKIENYYINYRYKILNTNLNKNNIKYATKKI